MRLIDATAVKKRADCYPPQIRGVVANILRHTKTVDAESAGWVRVVRCGECKWYGIYEAKKDGTPDKRYSPSVCLRGIYAKRRDPDWYCADGERKEGEGC